MTEGQYQALKEEIAQSMHDDICDCGESATSQGYFQERVERAVMPIVARELAAKDAENEALRQVIQQIREQHAKDPGYPDYCDYDGFIWPCPTARILSSLPSTGETALVIDAAHLAHQREWSERTFGPGRRTLGVTDHIRKELREIEDDPTDLSEWVDVVILALDGAWRAGHEPQQIIAAIKAKQARNEARTWPDWRTMSEDSAIEHDRTASPSTGETNNGD